MFSICQKVNTNHMLLWHIICLQLLQSMSLSDLRYAASSCFMPECASETTMETINQVWESSGLQITPL